MENNQTTDQQVAVDQVYGFAANMLVNENKNSYEVKNALIAQGLDEESASTVVTNLENQVYEAQRSAANKDMLYGALWCVGGTVATVADIGFIFWGAILFGGIQFIKGVVNYNKL